MGKNKDVPLVSTVPGTKLDAIKTRRDILNLLKRIIGYIPETKDANAMASLTTAIDTFLASSNTERSALVLREALYQIAHGETPSQPVRNEDWGEMVENAIESAPQTLYGSQKTYYQTTYNHLRDGEKGNYHSSDGKAVYLGACLGMGGQGAVYRITNMPGKAAKLFISPSDREYMERKIGALISRKVPSKLGDVLICALPETMLYDEKACFVGFSMPLLTTGCRLYTLYRNNTERKKYFPSLDYKGMISIAYNLSEIISHLHNHDIVVGDMNPSNILVNYDGTLCLTDTDSFDFTDMKSKEHFRCQVGMPEYLAPELQMAELLKNGNFSKESDSFSLAIIIFRLLMNSADPFGAAISDGMASAPDPASPSHEIINGECPYVRELAGKVIPSWAPPFDVLPEYIRNLFIRTFDYTSVTIIRKIRQRPTAAEWKQALLRFYKEPMKHCANDSFHWYRKELDKCPFCAILDRQRLGSKAVRLRVEI